MNSLPRAKPPLDVITVEPNPNRAVRLTDVLREVRQVASTTGNRESQKLFLTLIQRLQSMK